MIVARYVTTVILNEVEKYVTVELRNFNYANTSLKLLFSVVIKKIAEEF